MGQRKESTPKALNRAHWSFHIPAEAIQLSQTDPEFDKHNSRTTNG
jgi:hypothetical protein